MENYRGKKIKGNRFFKIYNWSVFFILVFFIWGKQHCYAQQTNLGTWNILNLKMELDKKWSVFGEAQIRSLSFYDQFHYYEYKAGINYKLFPNLIATLAAGNYDTYKEGGNFLLPKNNDEFRFWPQLQLLQSFGKVKVEQRYRVEARFTSIGYQNRYRYRLGVAYPFGKNKQGKKPFQFGLSNELFFTGKEPYFQRNRLLFSIQYKVSKQTGLQLGYLSQLDYKINDETGRDFLQLGIYFELYRKVNSPKK